MDTDIEPKVSIQMCTYNRAHYIEKAIQSVLSQSFTNWELLILDDASNDNTEEIVLKYLHDNRIKYFKNETNLGIASNRNKGLHNSTGEYIAVLDSDDYWIDNQKLEKQIDFLDTHKDYAIVGTNMLVINEKGNEIKKSNFKHTDKDIRRKMLLHDQISQSTVLYRKKIALSLGGYDATYSVCDDYDLWLKIGKDNKIMVLQDYTIKYLEHSQGISKEKKLKASIEHLHIINKYKKYYNNYILALCKSFLRILISKS